MTRFTKQESQDLQIFLGYAKLNPVGMSVEICKGMSCSAECLQSSLAVLRHSPLFAQRGTSLDCTIEKNLQAMLPTITNGLAIWCIVKMPFWCKLIQITTFICGDDPTKRLLTHGVPITQGIP